jgi:GxxExxY protein
MSTKDTKEITMLHRAATPLPEDIERICSDVLGCAIRVHSELGPGFRERIYEDALCLEMHSVGLAFERQKAITVRYRDWDLPGHRLDLVVEGTIIVELKCVRTLKSIHMRQVLSYLKASGLRLGLVMNFQTELLRNGIKRVIR